MITDTVGLAAARMKINTANLQRAAQIAGEIEVLELARDEVGDTPQTVRIPTSASLLNPLGQMAITVIVPATEIRAQLVALLTPLYAELHAMGIELER